MIYIKKQNAAIDYLLSEILEYPQMSHNISIRKQSLIRTYKREEKAHLEKEIICFLQNRIEQLWMESTKSALSKLEKQIKKLPDGVSGIEDLIKRFECLKELDQHIAADYDIDWLAL